MTLILIMKITAKEKM